jgi:hypothetical protein
MVGQLLTATAGFPASAHAAGKMTKAPVASEAAVSRPPAKPPASTSIKATPTPRPRAEGRSNIKAVPKVAPTQNTRGRVAVFGFRGEGGAPVHAQVVRLLRKRGFDVTTTLRPVDSPEQYRDMAALLGLAAYVDGDVIDDGTRASALVRIRSGLTGFRIASARFSGGSNNLPADVARGFWPVVGAAVSRACAHGSRPRKTEHAPLRIEAGTPIENTPAGSEGT